MQKLLLHTCCAPCSIVVIDELKNQYDLTVFFYNPNIFPEAEYLKRKGEVIRVCKEWNLEMVDADYENNHWFELTIGLEAEPEMGARCPICFRMRLEKTAQYAKDNHFDIFCTSLTSGRNKRAEIINPIGKNLSEKYGVEFLEADWKKDGRQEKATRLINERGIYRQNYCGCKFSLPKE